ncbi:hypothetical protein WG66_012358 [Moniliophthora roreri]|nr:hypothetical protein WG66_012358 [Moniliophthora roreri]
MATPCSSALQLDLRDTFGAFVVAIIISSCLYGVTCLQTWYYFQNYNDRFLLRGIATIPADVRHKKDWWTPTVVCILKATQVDMCSGQHHSIVNV